MVVINKTTAVGTSEVGPQIVDELKKLASLPGLITDEQGLILADLAGTVPAEQAIVEIGSFKGKSTCYLAFGAGQYPNGPLVWAIDPWDLMGNRNGKHDFAVPETRAAFDQAVETMGYESRIFATQAFSADAAENWKRNLAHREIGMLYIDGDHREDAVRNDVLAWFPLLAEKAILAFDDVDTPLNPGVRVVVDEILAAGGYDDYKQFGHLGVFWF